jgi:hypothetical protein
LKSRQSIRIARWAPSEDLRRRGSLEVDSKQKM